MRIYLSAYLFGTDLHSADAAILANDVVVAAAFGDAAADSWAESS
jgi:hypothetical protein